MTRKRVIIVGAGLAGVTTAFECVRRGCETTLVDAAPGVGLKTSFANGALLTPSMSDPWNAPGAGRQFAASLLDPHAAMKLRWRAIPSLAGWGLRFLANATPQHYRVATCANFSLARYSVDQTHRWREELGLRYSASSRGTLKVFATPQAMALARSNAETLVPFGLRYELLDAASAIAKEPSLAAIRDRISGAMFFPGDETGDAYSFCQALSEHFIRLGGDTVFGAQIGRLIAEGGQVRGVMLRGKRLLADCVVIASGNGSHELARQAGLALPIRPAKGYTLTFDNLPPGAPTMAVVDDAQHAAVVPLDTRLRIAGTAEFAGNNLSLNPARIDNLRRIFQTLYPDLTKNMDLSGGTSWTGLRPMSVDGIPFIGASNVAGLFVNSGHGHLGWTLAAGSACLVADAIMGTPPAIDPTPYRVSR